ncbi:hypothetical protein [Siminovitchia fordii]|uniref:Zinc-ribbon domain-containing protein n=1 Tax=Siminovitchia fordii TaxID=254759 RepID=A0ABQ4KBL2_9BACI|nr:hypothetical protein [Siminovitchia fordii]GIN23140.1 hypothetical protein J1TS3_42740 [Siminovitchia fordii]
MYKRNQHLKKTHQEYLKDIEKIYGLNHGYELLTDYNGMDYDIKILCNNCGNKWTQRAHRFLNPKNKNKIPCSTCNRNVNVRNRVSRIINMFNVASNGEYELLSEVVDLSSQINVRHLFCGYLYTTQIRLFIYENDRCPICTFAKRVSSLTNKIKELEGDKYCLVSSFNSEDNSSAFKIKHMVCGDEESVSVNDFINKNKRCMKKACSNRANKYNFKRLVHEKYGDEYIVLESYKGSSFEIKFKHNTENCGKVFKRKPKYFLSGKSLCVFCQRRSSNAERLIKSYLTQKKLFLKQSTILMTVEIKTL